MKLKVILTALLMGGLMSSAMADTMCEAQNVKSVASLTNTDSGGSAHIIAGKTQRSNLAFSTTVSGTECGNVVIAADWRTLMYADLCSNYYEPNIYNRHSHGCKAGNQWNEPFAYDLGIAENVSTLVWTCQRDNAAPCQAP